MQPVTLFTARIAVLLLVIYSCSGNNKSSQSKLGEISFTATGKKEAQSSFKNGLLYLHSFEYEDAAEEFQNAKRIDPEFASGFPSHRRGGSERERSPEAERPLLANAG